MGLGARISMRLKLFIFFFNARRAAFRVTKYVFTVIFGGIFFFFAAAAAFLAVSI